MTCTLSDIPPHTHPVRYIQVSSLGLLFSIRFHYSLEMPGAGSWLFCSESLAYIRIRSSPLPNDTALVPSVPWCRPNLHLFPQQMLPFPVQEKRRPRTSLTIKALLTSFQPQSFGIGASKGYDSHLQHRSPDLLKKVKKRAGYAVIAYDMLSRCRARMLAFHPGNRSLRKDPTVDYI